jgi:transposase-like protein
MIRALTDLASRSMFPDDLSARPYLETARWPNGPTCLTPGCLSEHCYPLKPSGRGRTEVRPGTWKCRNCRAQFRVEVGTWMEGAKVALQKWLWAVDLMRAAETITPGRLSRELMISYPTASLMIRRIEQIARTRKFRDAIRERRVAAGDLRFIFTDKSLFSPLSLDEAVRWMLHGPPAAPKNEVRRRKR